MKGVRHMSTLLVYFSQTGKTKEVAERIAKLVNANVVEIKTEKSYEMSYMATVFTSIKEILTKSRPKLSMEIPDCQKYNCILIGCPIWCGTVPNAVLTFLEQADLTGKHMALFTTSGSTKPLKAAVKLKNSYSEARWHRPLNGNDVTDEDIKSWLGR